MSLNFRLFRGGIRLLQLGGLSGSPKAGDIYASSLDNRLYYAKTTTFDQVVLATDTQTLTHKTLTSPVITSPTGLVKADVGLSAVDNTSDANKPISTATQSALDLKAPIVSPTFTGTVSGITKSMVGLGNADNTSDANKPISTATQTALDLKAPIASPTFTGTVSGITKSMVGLGNVDNTSDVNKPVSTATQTALNLKAPLASPTFTGTVIVPATITSGSAVLTFPTSTATLSTLALAETLSNKTLTAPIVDELLLTEAAAPGTPASGKLALYAKTDHSVYIKDSTGTETNITPSGSAQIKAWFNMSANQLSGTYTQTGTTVTQTMTAHGGAVGMKVFIDITSGTGVDGWYTITAATANTFTYTAGTSLTTSGAATRRLMVRSSYNLDPTTPLVRNSAGVYTANFAAGTFTTDYIVGSGNASDGVTQFIMLTGPMTPPTSTSWKFAAYTSSAVLTEVDYYTLMFTGI